MSPSGTADPLDAADYLDILNLYGRYNRLIDSQSYQSWVDECFTADAEFAVPYAKTVHRGHNEIIGFATRYMSRSHGLERHFTTNIELWRRDEETAEGHAYLIMATASVGKTPPSLVSTGRYEDLMQRTPEGWRFARRTLIFAET